MTRASNGGIMVKNRDCGARLLGFCQQPLCDLGVPLQVTEPFNFSIFLFINDVSIGLGCGRIHECLAQ